MLSNRMVHPSWHVDKCRTAGNCLSVKVPPTSTPMRYVCIAGTFWPRLVNVATEPATVILPFVVTGGNIAPPTDRTVLVRLRRSLGAEAQAHGLPEHGIHVAGIITTPDGSEGLARSGVHCRLPP